MPLPQEVLEADSDSVDQGEHLQALLDSKYLHLVLISTAASLGSRATSRYSEPHQ